MDKRDKETRYLKGRMKAAEKRIDRVMDLIDTLVDDVEAIKLELQMKRDAKALENELGIK